MWDKLGTKMGQEFTEFWYLVGILELSACRPIWCPGDQFEDQEKINDSQ